MSLDTRRSEIEVPKIERAWWKESVVYQVSLVMAAS